MPEGDRRTGEERRTPVNAKEFNHYFKDVRHLDYVDVYRVCELFGIADPCLQHALKKLLCTGNRGVKASVATPERDIKEVIASCTRWLEMQQENSDKPLPLVSEPAAGVRVVIHNALDGVTASAESIPAGESSLLPSH